MNKVAHSSLEYIAKMKNMPALSPTQKQAKLESLMKQSDGLEKLGQGMIGPVLLRLRYDGICRNVLMEDPLAAGAALVYDVLDDLGKAYYLNDNESEVKVTPFEGKRVEYQTFRLAAYPSVKKEDLYSLRVNTIENAQEESKQAILKQEDSRLFKLLNAALADYSVSSDHVITPDHTVTAELLMGTITPEALNDAAGLVEMHELSATNLIGNPMDIRKMNTWGVETVGWKFKDEIVDGMKVTKFGEFTVQRSVLLPSGEAFLLPEARFLGMMPVRYSLDVVENNVPEKFSYGWVMDEVIGQVILNPRGIAKLELGGS